MKLVLGMMLLSGAMLLAASLPAAFKICQKDSKPGWKALLLLIFCFLFGYITFFLLLISHEYSQIDLVVTLILLGGGAFVFLIIRLSLTSIAHAQLLAHSEAYNALHDALTGLPNRSFLDKNLDKELQIATKSNVNLSVLMIDLNRFKEINDTLGHAIGDQVLIQVTQRFKNTLSKELMLARLGGDEFAVILPSTGIDDAIRIGQRLHNALEPVIEVDHFPLTVDMSVGVATFPKDGGDRHTLMKRADIAMYQAKRSKISCAVYDETMDRHSVRRLQLLPRIKEALMKGAFELYYQPIIDTKTNSVCALEALMRWPDLDGENVSPAEFIPLAEETNCIKDITQWVVEQAIKQAKIWSEHYPKLHIHINLSALDIQDVNFPVFVEKLLNDYALPPQFLIFEITESAMMQDIEQVRMVLNKLGEMGISLAVDDFGTGYSSLTLLRELPTEDIKVDRSFVIDMENDASNASIVQATVDLAHNIGRKVIAEGVETEATRQALLAMGCDRLQGYLICKPLNLESINHWLENNANTPYNNVDSIIHSTKNTH